MRIAWCVLTVGVILGTLSGCGGPEAKPTPTDSKTTLAELGQALKTAAADGKRPPTKPAEFELIEPMAPMAGPLVKSGEIVYLWGGGFVQGGTKVVAYEKNAESAGGQVLLEDGTVKQMTADELKAAPKAGLVKK